MTPKPSCRLCQETRVPLVLDDKAGYIRCRVRSGCFARLGLLRWKLAEPTHEPAHEPTHEPAHEPTHEPTHEPAHEPTHEPTHEPAHEEEP